MGLAWWVSGRIGVRKLSDRLLLAILLGFSTQIWWVTTRGGVWHTGHLVATILTLLLIAELFGRQRPLLMGLLVGVGFLTRAPLAFAEPALALWPVRRGRRCSRAGRSLSASACARCRGARGCWLAVGFLPSLAFFFWYNDARFGSPLESGYALATLPPWLQALRDAGPVLDRPTSG